VTRRCNSSCCTLLEVKEAIMKRLEWVAVKGNGRERERERER
jgi:hypothetical protein